MYEKNSQLPRAAIDTNHHKHEKLLSWATKPIDDEAISSDKI